MNYDTMTDRELDAAVAEKVMGWEVTPGNNYWHTIGQYEWHPSTSIADAWQVVERMGLSILRWDNNGTVKWQARRYVTIQDECASPWHTNPARAICIAALKAVEAKA